MTNESNVPSPEETLQRLIADYLHAIEARKSPNREELLARHPDLADSLAGFFRDHDRMQQRADKLLESDAVANNDPAEARTLAPGEHPGTAPKVLRYFGDYELLEEIACGGMGVVYRARQVSLNRIVALKMILAGQFASPEDVQRFHREAESAANLDHPNIVPVYEVGEHEGQHYFSMKLVDGGSLAQRLPKGEFGHITKSLQRKAVKLLATVARAVHHAHQRGVLHRDLKPGNILIDNQITPYVTDFGLAKRVEGSADRTHSGVIVGTPSYMAPEQARSEKVLSKAVDVYSLGAILYEMLTGRPPFKANTPLDTVLQVIDGAPESVRRLNPVVDLDLETICLKCLDKRPHRRYPSAEALAEDLENWLESKPILARPVGPTERLWLWCRRKPVIAGLTATASGLLALAALLTMFSHSKTKEAEEFKQFASREERHASEAEAKRKESEAIAQNEKARREEEQEQARKLRAAQAYLVDMPKAAQLQQAGDLGGARKLLGKYEPRTGQPDLRGWEWYFLSAECRATQFELPGAQVSAVAWSPDDSQLAAAVQGAGVRIWNVADLRECTHLQHPAGDVFALGWNRRGQQLAGASLDGTVQIWDTVAGRGILTLRTAEPVRVDDAWPGFSFPAFVHKSVLWRADGQKVALTAEDGIIRIWDTASGKETFILRASPSRVHSAAWSPDGRQLASVGSDGVVKIWDAATGEQLSSLSELVPPAQAGRPPMAFALLWRADGKHLAAVRSDGWLKEWDVRTEALVSAGNLDLRESLDPSMLGLHEFFWSPDGKLLASIGNGTIGPNPASAGLVSDLVRIWDPATLKLVPWGRTAERAQCPPAWNSSSRRVAVVGFCQDSQHQLRNILHVFGVGRERVPVRTPVRDALGWSADGQHLFGLAGGVGQTYAERDFRQAEIHPPWAIRTWDALTGVVTRTLGELGSGPFTAASESPDGQWVASCTREGLLQLWSSTAGSKAFTLEMPPEKSKTQSAVGELANNRPILIFAWSPDSKTLATAASDKRPLWNDSRTLATAARNTTAIFLWNTTTRKLMRTLSGHGKPLRSLAWSPDGKHLASAGHDGQVRIWETNRGEEILQCPFPVEFYDPGRAGAKTFSILAWRPDGKQLAVAGEDDLIKIWEMPAGKEITSLQGDEAPKFGAAQLFGVAWSPDGKRLASASADGHFVLWDTATWRKILTLCRDEYITGGQGGSLAWSSDGWQLGFFGETGAVSIWDATPE
jgi:WD40 repeat protein/serine/threonine protein kinase